jgi:hypothetical protein
MYSIYFPVSFPVGRRLKLCFIKEIQKKLGWAIGGFNARTIEKKGMGLLPVAFQE